MEKEETFSIPSLPMDDKEYVVKWYGLMRKNPSVHATGFLVQVVLENINTNQALTIEVRIAYLLALRIDSVWKNQKLLYDRVESVKEGFVYKSRRSFNLNSSKAQIMCLVQDRSKGAENKAVIPLMEYNRGRHEFLASYTGFVTTNGQIVLIPSLEIFVSTYVPETHTILEELLSYSNVDEDILPEHLSESGISDEYEYVIGLEKNHRASTSVFLAYLACNNMTRENVSKIRSNIINSDTTLSLHGIDYKIPAMFPYHPSTFSISASGVHTKNDRVFWVSTIDSYSLPDDNDVIVLTNEEKVVDQADKPEKEYKKTLPNTDPINHDVELNNSIDAGTRAGIKYIKARIDIRGIDKVRTQSKRSSTRSNATTQYIAKEQTEAISAAASELTGQVESENVSGVDFRPDRSEYPIDSVMKSIIDAIDLLKVDRFFLNNDCLRAREVQFCELEGGGEYSWATINKRPRQLLVCEILLNGKYLYILDIERYWSSESYKGIAFYRDVKLDEDLLHCIIKDTRKNEGVFSNQNKDRVTFPVEGYILFNHRGEDHHMNSYIESLVKRCGNE